MATRTKSLALRARRKKDHYLPLSYTERVFKPSDTGLPTGAQRMSSIRDVIRPTEIPVYTKPTTVKVEPYSREGRRVSGYRAQRYRVMRRLSGGREPVCSGPECGQTDVGELTISHVVPDEFSGYEARSGGAAYARWMKHVATHPENYRVLCASHHGAEDCRVVPSPRTHRVLRPEGPRVHRKKVVAPERLRPLKEAA